MDWPRLLKRLLLTLLVLGLAVELAWILKTKPDRRDPQAEAAAAGAAAAAASKSSTPTSGPTSNSVDPNAIVFGAMVDSTTVSAVETGIRLALVEAVKNKIEAAGRVKIVRCLMNPPEAAQDCSTIFRNANVRAIIANPEVDPGIVLDQMTGDAIPYIGAFPNKPAEYIDPNSFQLSPGERGLVLAPLSWAIEVEAPSIVLVSTDATRPERDEFLAAATASKMAVQAFDFRDVGTDVKPYLETVKNKKPVIVFLTENAGCDVVLRGLTRRRPTLADGMEATFIANACSEAAVRANLDGLRLLSARSFANETLSDPESVAEASGRATLTALLDILPPTAWEDGASSLRTALRGASQATPASTLGAWNCASRKLNDDAALCGRQTQVVGLGTDTRGIAVWIDALPGR